MNFFDVFGGRRGEFFDAPLRGSLEGGGGIWSRSASKSGAEDVVFCFSCSKRSIACVVRPSSFCLLFGSPSFFCCEHCVLDVCKEWGREKKRKRVFVCACLLYLRLQVQIQWQSYRVFLLLSLFLYRRLSWQPQINTPSVAGTAKRNKGSWMCVQLVSMTTYMVSVYSPSRELPHQLLTCIWQCINTDYTCMGGAARS